MFDKLEDVLHRYKAIEHQLADPDIAGQPELLRQLSQEHSNIEPIVQEYIRYKNLSRHIQETKQLLEESKDDFALLAKEELKALEIQLEDSKSCLQVCLLPVDPNDKKNVILEIRAGAGGDEAAIFAGELFRLYQKYAERHHWTVELLSANSTGLGGFKEIIAQMSGVQVYSRLKYEAGVHRVQRVPQTEAQGRVHTSTVTVAVLPEVDEVDINISPTDLRIDVFRSGGAGGQGVNTTDSAVRITHIPTGTVVVCQDERSQHKNKSKAMKILRSRIFEVEQQRIAQSHAAVRKSMVGTGDRSERIRTYNFPQGRLTDHRIGLTLYQLPEVMEGKIDEVLDALINHYQALALKEQGFV